MLVFKRDLSYTQLMLGIILNEDTVDTIGHFKGYTVDILDSAKLKDPCIKFD